MINEDLTFKLFGYTSFNIIIGYYKPFVRSCDKCGKNEILKYLSDDISDLCRVCRTEKSWLDADERREELSKNTPFKSQDVIDIVKERMTNNNPMSDPVIAKKVGESHRGLLSGDKNPSKRPEIKIKISEGCKRRYEDPEERKKQSKRTQKRYDEMDDPGQEICMHHYIYDFNDLDKYRIPVTRSEHTVIHANLRRAELEVPCINIMKGDE
jgi:hypothetical protein